MEYNVKVNKLATLRTQCVVVGVYASGKLSKSSQLLDSASKGYLSDIVSSGDLGRDVGQHLLLHNVPHVKAERVLLVNAGKDSEFDENAYLKLIAMTTRYLQNSSVTEAVYALNDLVIKGKDLAWKVAMACVSSEQSLYHFKEFKTKPATHKQPLSSIHFYVSNSRDQKQALAAVKFATSLSQGMTRTKNLANRPANVCHPESVAKEAKKLGQTYPKLKVSVMQEAQMKKLGMGALLAVAKGSNHAPRLVTLEYSGGKASQKPVVLIGKGITFDTGGLSLKPAGSMVGMKYDMCGSATVMGVIEAIAKLKLPVNVVGMLVLAENMPGPNATRPDDIVTSMSGQTIEITNTDAEGRLVLCDALTYCEKFKPAYVIDIATLTGAIVIALGEQASGLFSNDDKLAKALLKAGDEINDRAWRMPVWDSYHPLLESPVADFVNAPAIRQAQSITAACFLAKFTKKYRWAHLDVAATAHTAGKHSKATARPVPLLVQFLKNYAGK